MVWSAQTIRSVTRPGFEHIQEVGTSARYLQILRCSTVLTPGELAVDKDDVRGAGR